MIFDTLTLFALAFAVLATLVNGNPSAVPYNGYTCPPQDKGNFAVGVTNYASDPIFCAYPMTQGSSDTTFNCHYSAVNHPRFIFHSTYAHGPFFADHGSSDH